MSEKEIYYLREFSEFLRLKICILVAGIGISGFLLFNQISIKILYVALGSFFVGAASYSYNLVTDKEEDLINHKKINWFVTNNLCFYLIICFLTIGLASVLFLSTLSILFYISSALSGIIYSYQRIKTIFPLKNLYTAMSLTQAFMIGAVNVSVTIDMLLYVLPLFLLLFVASLISDLRDYTGDRLAGIRTVPVVLGYEFSKKVLYFVLIIFLTTIFAFGLYGLLPLVAFIPPITLLINLDQQKKAHLTIMASFMCLPFGIYLLKIIQ